MGGSDKIIGLFSGTPEKESVQLLKVDNERQTLTKRSLLKVRSRDTNFLELNQPRRSVLKFGHSPQSP